MHEKLFGRDIGMRSTLCKYDPCVTGPRRTLECENCMVSLISDRCWITTIFGKEFRSYLHNFWNPPREYMFRSCMANHFPMLSGVSALTTVAWS